MVDAYSLNLCTCTRMPHGGIKTQKYCWIFYKRSTAGISNKLFQEGKRREQDDRLGMGQQGQLVKKMKPIRLEFLKRFSGGGGGGEGGRDNHFGGNKWLSYLQIISMICWQQLYSRDGCWQAWQNKKLIATYMLNSTVRPVLKTYFN